MICGFARGSSFGALRSATGLRLRPHPASPKGRDVGHLIRAFSAQKSSGLCEDQRAQAGATGGAGRWWRLGQGRPVMPRNQCCLCCHLPILPPSMPAELKYEKRPLSQVSSTVNRGWPRGSRGQGRVPGGLLAFIVPQPTQIPQFRTLQRVTNVNVSSPCVPLSLAAL